MCRRKLARTSSRISAAPVSSQSARAARANSGVGSSWSLPMSCLKAETMTPAKSLRTGSAARDRLSTSL
jgi:hypothetical protein